MTWLEDIDVRAADRFARALFGAPTVAELRRRALSGLAELVPADVLMWDRVDLGTGVVRHEVIPADAEPPGAFAAIVGDASGHPLLSAHAARGRPALRLSEAAAPRRLLHSELHGDLLHPSGVEYAIAIGVRAEHGEIEHSSFDAERWLPSISNRPSTPAGCPRPSPRGSLCRRVRRSSASGTGDVSPSSCCLAIRTRCCWRKRSRAFVPAHSFALV